MTWGYRICPAPNSYRDVLQPLQWPMKQNTLAHLPTSCSLNSPRSCLSYGAIDIHEHSWHISSSLDNFYLWRDPVFFYCSLFWLGLEMLYLGLTHGHKCCQIFAGSAYKNLRFTWKFLYRHISPYNGITPIENAYITSNVPLSYSSISYHNIMDCQDHCRCSCNHIFKNGLWR